MTGHSRTLWSLTFAWTALSGFQSTGIPIFAQAAFSGFRLAGCTDFFHFIPYFCPNPFGSPGSPNFFPRYVNLAGLWLRVVFFSTMSMLSECRELPLLEVRCHATRRCLIRQDSLLECPKWLRRRFAPGYLAFERFSESWLNYPRWWTIVMPCPLIGSAFVH